MTNILKPKRQDADSCIEESLQLLRRARDLLVLADCPRSASAVRKAIASVGGAQRHAQRRPVAACRMLEGQALTM